MKKNDLKNTIEAIKPDDAMKTRLKAKVAEEKSPKGYSWTTAIGIVATMFAFAMIFSYSLPNINTDLKNESGIVESEIRIPQGFIMVASAAESEQQEKYEKLEINDTFPFAYSISVTDVRNMTEQEKSSVAKQCADDLDEKTKEIVRKNNEGAFYTASASVSSHENIVFSSVSLNSIKLDLKNKEKIESINIRCSSKWGAVEYIDDKNCGVDEEKGVALVPPHGNEITVAIEDYDEVKGIIYWTNSVEMEEVLNNNPDLPLSTFKDTATITVNYKDGQKAIGIIDVAFDDDGNATFTCKDYKYE
ncbi:MAG: hypothetical protein IJM97_03080 [Clostridia bacterium]|nr:hypothetical protein [Clostridia bacterium]